MSADKFGKGSAKPASRPPSRRANPPIPYPAPFLDRRAGWTWHWSCRKDPASSKPVYRTASENARDRLLVHRKRALRLCHAFSECRRRKEALGEVAAALDRVTHAELLTYVRYGFDDVSARRAALRHAAAAGWESAAAGVIETSGHIARSPELRQSFETGRALRYATNHLIRNAQGNC